MSIPFRTDSHNNPAAFTTDIARQAKLQLGTDYVTGEPFSTPGGGVLYTAKLIGDSVAQTIRVIDAIGYQTLAGAARWTYIKMPKFVWDALTPPQKRDVIGYHYQHEGGTEMRKLFPNYGKL